MLAANVFTSPKTSFKLSAVYFYKFHLKRQLLSEEDVLM